MRLLSDIWAFICAVGRHWTVLMGGVVMTVFALIQQWRGSPISPKLYWPIIIGFVVVAIFLTWRTERQELLKLISNKLTITPRELTRVYDGRTDVQGEVLAATHKDKWIEVSGTLGNVTVRRNPALPFLKFAWVTFGGVPGVPSSLMFMHFGHKWVAALSMLQTGEQIKVLGQVDKVERTIVQLKRCELIDITQLEQPKREAAT